jgi:hypothetical protein
MARGTGYSRFPGPEEAFALLRAEVGDPDLRELVVLGAQRKLELEHERERTAARRCELRERLIARATEPGAIDRAAATAVWPGEPDTPRSL